MRPEYWHDVSCHSDMVQWNNVSEVWFKYRVIYRLSKASVLVLAFMYATISSFYTLLYFMTKRNNWSDPWFCRSHTFRRRAVRTALLHTTTTYDDPRRAKLQILILKWSHGRWQIDVILEACWRGVAAWIVFGACCTCMAKFFVWNYPGCVSKSFSEEGGRSSTHFRWGMNS